MKKNITLLFFGSFFLLGCRGQQSKFSGNIENENAFQFEEKQLQSLKNEHAQKQTASVSGFNFRYAAKKATPGVVHVKSLVAVKSSKVMPEFFKDFFDQDFLHRYFPSQDNTPQYQMGSASGVIISEDGYIVTNNHVIEGVDSIEVVLYDQRSYKATIIGKDPATDLALLKIDEHKLNFIEFGNSDSVEVGDMVLAVGNPFNLASTVTAGIVSAKARNINILTDKAAVESYIQTDAAVNRGNSGGALVDINGKLIGINAAISTPTGVYAGYSFAIPVEIVKKTMDDLLKHGKVMRGYLGIMISEMNSAKAKMLGINITTGVIVDSLLQNGAAIVAGIQRKDVIIKIDNHLVETAPQLREIIARQRPGEKLAITVIRGGKEKIIPVTLLAEKIAITAVRAGNELLKNLGIEVENLSPKDKKELKITGGVKIIDITDGKISFYTDIRKGFIVSKVNGKVINSTDEFIKQLIDKTGGVLLEGLYPGLSRVYYYAFGL